MTSIIGAFGTSIAALTDESSLNLTGATVVVRDKDVSEAEATAARVLVEEVEERTGIRWSIETDWPSTGPAIVMASGEFTG